MKPIEKITERPEDEKVRQRPAALIMQLSKYRSKPLSWWLQTPLYAARIISVRLNLPWKPNVELSRYKTLRNYIDLPEGFFVEAGANDGISQSNTIYFERNGWTGLLIEPIPELAARCRENRTVPVVECALGGPELVGQNVTMTYGHLMSTINGIGSEVEQREQLEGAHRFLPRGQTIYEVDVMVQTLTDIFQEHGAQKIDLLCLDLEGFEPQALQGLNFDYYRPTWLLIEVRYRDAVENEIGNLYKAVATIEGDVLYRIRSDAPKAISEHVSS